MIIYKNELIHIINLTIFPRINIGFYIGIGTGSSDVFTPTLKVKDGMDVISHTWLSIEFEYPTLLRLNPPFTTVAATSA